MVAGSGIEPLTSGLWVLRSNQLSYPAIKNKINYINFTYLYNHDFKNLYNISGLDGKFIT